MIFRCAGKVFITGEYACIEGGPSLIGTVAPSFELRVVRERGEHALPFADLSPAGLYLNANRDALRDVRLEWRDPYSTPIGVGSSSAQFIMSVAAVFRLRDQAMPGPQDVLDLYWRTVGASQGLRPSGVDVVAQWLGGPAVIRNSPYTSQKLAPWKSDSTFILAYTGKKAKTHEHLKKLSERGFPDAFRDVLNRLNEITVGAIEAWEAGNSRLLGSALNAFQETLTRGELAPASFTEELRILQRWPGVYGAKGSGAQGGDCVLMLVEDRLVNQICEDIRNLGWSPTVASWTHEGIASNP